MNKKVIGIGIVIGVVVLAVAGYFVNLQRQAAKWKEAKEIVEETITRDGDVTHIRFVSVLDGSLDRVQNALWEVEKSAELVENINRSKLLSSEGNSKVVQLDLRALNLPLQRITMKFTLDAQAHRISFDTVESQTQLLKGFYQLEASPDGKRTRIIYDTEARQKVSLPFPQSVLDSANRETFVNTIRGAKKSVAASAAK